MAHVRNIYPERFQVGEAHPEDCSCKVCARLTFLLEEIKRISPFQLPQEKKVESSCRVISKIMNEALEDLRDVTVDIKGINEEHEELFCNCLQCSVIESLGQNLQSQGSSSDAHDSSEKTTVENHHLDCDETALIFSKDRPIAVCTRNGEVVSSADVSSHIGIPISVATNKNQLQENVKKLTLKETTLEKVIDVCVCGQGTVSKACLQHIPACCRHADLILAEEGCTCSGKRQCSYCLKLECYECQHVNTELYECADIFLSQENEMAEDISNWIDNKLSAAGIQFDWSKSKKEQSSQDHKKKAVDEAELCDNLADSVDKEIIQEWSWNAAPVQDVMKLTETMKSEILNVNELFDIKPWPRCYRLKGKTDADGSQRLDENFCELTFEAWKQPSLIVEDTFPLGVKDIPPHDQVISKESEIRVPLYKRMGKSARRASSKKVIGIDTTWRPVTKHPPEGKKNFRWSKKEKEEKCKELIMQIEQECPDVERATQFPNFEKVQAILNQYCEEPYPAPDIPKVLGEKELKDWVDRVSKILPEQQRLGFVPEFWEGLEKWRPDPGENELRSRIKEEVKEFKKRLDPLKKAAPLRGVQTNRSYSSWSTLVDAVIAELPEEIKDDLLSIKEEVRKKWLGETGLALLENALLSGECDSSPLISDTPAESEETPEVEEPVLVLERDDNSSENSSDECEPLPKLDNIERYDDEDAVEEEVGLLPINVKERWEKEVSELSISLARESTKEMVDIDSEMKSGHAKLLDQPLTQCPYIDAMVKKMESYCPNELHPIQQFWKDQPFFPFWTPKVLYNLADIEKSAFSNTEECNDESDYEEECLDDLEKTILSSDQPQDTPEGGVDTTDKDTKEEEEENVSELLNLLQLDDEWDENLKSSSTPENDGNVYAGSLTLKQLETGVAGRVCSTAPYALELDSSCKFDMASIIPDPAHNWDFSLDTFQKQAIVALEAGLNVFVLAHTSAGKTVAAEYTIGMAKRNGSKVIYTSPIKALSNQKYKDFKETYKKDISIGIITGDVQLNEDAQCLIMTTEILRSMLYNNSTRLHELEFVIFDEVHYFNDPERGNVWEEVLILLPNKCQILMLSATVSNPMEFASWVGRRKERTVVVTRTTKRPTPLKHYLHVGTTPESTMYSYPLEVGRGFNDNSYKEAMKVKKSLSDLYSASKSGRPGRHNLNNSNLKKAWVYFIKNHLKMRDCLPAVVFSFSRKRCDMYASYLSKINLTEKPSDADFIKKFIQQNLMKISPSDRKISQIVKMISLLERGIGVHHSGILPILKEIVEVLFQHGKVKLLFATETFAMGVNMPARTVVFSAVKKFDGEDHRFLKPAEYTQMAGRAGRRGKDISGKVIILSWEQDIPSSALSQMMTSESEKLQSRFRLRYSMILNTLNPRGDLSIDRIMNSTFLEHSLTPIIEGKKKRIAELKASVAEVDEKLSTKLSKETKNMLFEYFSHCRDFIMRLQSQTRADIIKNTRLSQFLRVGRGVVICHTRYSVVQGIIVDISPSLVCKVAILREYVPDIPSVQDKYPLAEDLHDKIWRFCVGYRPELFDLCSSLPHHGPELIEVKANDVISFIDAEIPVPPEVLSAMQVMSSRPPVRIGEKITDLPVRNFYEVMQKVLSYNHCYIDEDSCIMQGKQRDERTLKLQKEACKLRTLLAYISSSPISYYSNMDNLLDTFWVWMGQEDVKVQEDELRSKSCSITLFPDYKNKLALLIGRSFLEEDEILTLQGNIASRIPTHEVFITEVLLKNMMDKLTAPEVAALLSCLVYQDNNRMATETNAYSKDLQTKDGILRENVLSPSDLKKLREIERKNAKFKATITETAAELAEKEPMETRLQKVEQSLPQHLKQAVEDLMKLRDELSDEELQLGITDSEISKISFGLVPVIYEWARGQSFQEVMNLISDRTQEGILVRWIQQLIEALKDIESASRLMGDSNTTEKLANAATSIKRGIVYHQSIYLD